MLRVWKKKYRAKLTEREREKQKLMRKKDTNTEQRREEDGIRKERERSLWANERKGLNWGSEMQNWVEKTTKRREVKRPPHSNWIFKALQIFILSEETKKHSSTIEGQCVCKCARERESVSVCVWADVYLIESVEESEWMFLSVLEREMCVRVSVWASGCVGVWEWKKKWRNGFSPNLKRLLSSE